MLIINATEEQLSEAVRIFNLENDATVRIVNFQNKSSSRRTACRCRFVPNRSTDLYSRRSYTGRRVNALCWHGHRDLFRHLFRAIPELEIRTARAIYKGLEGFEAEYGATGNHNIGSMAQPLEYKEACDCLDWS